MKNTRPLLLATVGLATVASFTACGSKPVTDQQSATTKVATPVIPATTNTGNAPEDEGDGTNPQEGTISKDEVAAHVYSLWAKHEVGYHLDGAKAHHTTPEAIVESMHMKVTCQNHSC